MRAHWRQLSLSSWWWWWMVMVIFVVHYAHWIWRPMIQNSDVNWIQKFLSLCCKLHSIYLEWIQSCQVHMTSISLTFCFCIIPGQGRFCSILYVETSMFCVSKTSGTFRYCYDKEISKLVKLIQNGNKFLKTLQEKWLFYVMTNLLDHDLLNWVMNCLFTCNS